MDLTDLTLVDIHKAERAKRENVAVAEGEIHPEHASFLPGKSWQNLMWWISSHRASWHYARYFAFCSVSEIIVAVYAMALQIRIRLFSTTKKKGRIFRFQIEISKNQNNVKSTCTDLATF